MLYNSMKAYKVKAYGKPSEVLNLIETPIPTIGENEVLIQVKATTVNDYDWCITSGTPTTYRLFFGLFKPRKKLQTPGMEVAGIIEKVGNKVTQFKAGDKVYGDISDVGFGSYAEYLAVHENGIIHMPEKMSFEEACTIPHAALLALQGLKNLGKIQEGFKVLINGAGGGVGSFCLQIAKDYNCHVTGVDTGPKLQKMLALGYDEVIDYKTQNFTELGQQYDLILDCRTSFNLWTYFKALKRNGKYISVGGKSGKLLQLLWLSQLSKIFTNKRIQMLALKANKGLEEIHQLYGEGKLKTTIDGPYSFDELPKAVQRFGDALHHGKIVISLNK